MRSPPPDASLYVQRIDYFQVADRQALQLDPLTGEPAQPGVLAGAACPPEAWEMGGFKDTVIVYLGEVTRVRGRFDVGAYFVWHCHSVEHEDNEMMRPYGIGPVDPNVPA